jgi:phosphoglycolate phosphatase-like HAD superfamily hydrolase
VAADRDVLALFDLDGTLIRVGDRVHHAAFEHATRVVLGEDLDITTLDLAGAVDRRLFDQVAERIGLDPGDADARFPGFVAALGDYYADRVGAGDRTGWVLPGVPDLLLELRATGVAIAIATGSTRAVAEAKLIGAGLDGHFPTGAFGDEARDRAALVHTAWTRACAHHGRSFPVTDTVVIGDTPADIAAARHTGTRVVAVATGRFGVDELDGHGPDATFADLADVAAVVRAISGPGPAPGTRQ